MPKHSFVKRNIVAIVMIPSIIGIHFGWNMMQNNRTLVSESEQFDLPPVMFAKYCWEQLKSLGADKRADAPAVKAAPTNVK